MPEMIETADGYVGRLIDRINLRISEAEFETAATFARLFWSRTPEADLLARDVDDDAGAMIDSWRLFKTRPADDVQIYLTNPVHARDGWQSSHTVVRVIAPDMPFMVDSILLALSHDGLITHHLSNIVFAVERDECGEVLSLKIPQEHVSKELFIYAEIDRVDNEDIAALQLRLEETTADLSAVVNDFQPMKEQLRRVIDELRQSSLPLSEEDVDEAVAFLEWLESFNFTFLGYREFDYTDDMIRQTPDALGVLRRRTRASERRLSEQPKTTQAFLLEPTLLSFSKSGTKSRVHRPAYPDYVGIKKIDADGQVIGEHGFLGLYTSRVYVESPTVIPVLRRKVANVVARSDLDPNGFDGKVLAQVLATYPRDELFQVDEDDLFENAIAITYIHERRRIRLFTRFERYGLFVNCLVFLPRDLFNTQARIRIQELLIHTFDAEDLEFDIYLSESILVRLQVTLRIRPGPRISVDAKQLEAQIVELTSDWLSDLNTSLLAVFGETQGRRHAKEYNTAFPAAYRENFKARAAADDIASIESLSLQSNLLTQFYRLPEDAAEVVRLKIYFLGEPLPLSDIIPELENMGLRVNGFHPYRVLRDSGPLVSIHDFYLSYAGSLNLSKVGERFDDAFVRIWAGSAEDDSYNRLILGAGLNWRQVGVLRAFARYMKQIRFGFSQEFISDTLDKHRAVTRDLARYFEQKFDPDGGDVSGARIRISLALDQVELLNEDRILRRFLEVMDATRRTNYFIADDKGVPRNYLSLKFAPGEISDMPKPLPLYEIFVCAPHFEGVHLRGGMIARGGLRWSDRLEDYRTEVLGLVKAQVVKNGVIVPTGAKGGFVLKERHGSQDVVECYRDFISGLLDVTDNIVQGEIVVPEKVRRFDGDDPYLVVAADKGTATFSDDANAVAEDYGFWLRDAFASGGSFGYDHKKMGITARGAWVSVQQHFLERGIDVQREPITVLGIGDMGGDVFGNGMLLSTSIKLVAAFNHLHIFIDPNPDPRQSHAERQRMFEMPRSSWEDYDASLISTGGGIFSRQAKSINVTPEMQEVFAIQQSSIAPDELIHELLKAPVQLIWNGGIGTYVKAARETDVDVGDRANDHLRVDAEEVRASAFGEGGNLGITQIARIVFGLNGGAVNTDFIDNSAGVDCSDHEVNIKIALNEIVLRDDLTLKQRNVLLEEMTDEVAALVLANNHRQVQALSLAERHAAHRQAEYQRFISRMEVAVKLDRALESLPTDEELSERFGTGQGLSRPELAVLLAYSKIFVKSQLVESSIGDDPLIAREILSAFPARLVELYGADLMQHRLRNEIVSTQLANNIVDHMGITFVVHLMEFVGGTVEDIARAYMAASESFSVRAWYQEVAAADGVEEELKLEILLELIRLGRRATRWILRHRRELASVEEFVENYQPRVAELIESRELLVSEQKSAESARSVAALVGSGISESLAKRSVAAAELVLALPIIDAADKSATQPARVARVFSAVAGTLGLDWVTEQLGQLPSSSHWQSMERDSLLDDITTYQGVLAAQCLAESDGDVQAWLSSHGRFAADWNRVLEDAQHASVQDFSMFSMTCRKLGDLCRSI